MRGTSGKVVQVDTSGLYTVPQCFPAFQHCSVCCFRAKVFHFLHSMYSLSTQSVTHTHVIPEQLLQMLSIMSDVTIADDSLVNFAL